MNNSNYLMGEQNLLFSGMQMSKNARYFDPVYFADEVWVNCHINIPELRDYYWVSSLINNKSFNHIYSKYI